MRLALAFAAVVVGSVTIAVAVLGLVKSPSAGVWAQCIVTLRWHDRPYLGYGGEGVKTGGVLTPKAVLPGCNDTPGDGADEPDVAVTARRVRGVDPLIAIHYRDSTYVNPSTFVALPSHPLHEALGGRRTTRRTGTSCRVNGRAEVDWEGLRVGDAHVTVASDTDVELQRHGTGYVPAGARVTVSGRPCKRRGGVLWISARRIARAR